MVPVLPELLRVADFLERQAAVPVPALDDQTIAYDYGRVEAIHTSVLCLHKGAMVVATNLPFLFNSAGER
jgi:hypothetical protein